MSIVYTYDDDGNINDERVMEDVPKDEKRRILPIHMSDRMLMEETVLTLRQMSDLMGQFLGDMEKNPMMKTMSRVFGGR